MTAQTWLTAFFNALDKVYKRDKYASAQWTDTKWTEYLGEVLEEVGDSLNCYVAQRRKVVKEDFYSGEYLNIDAMFISLKAYEDYKDKKWDPPVLPKAVVELENNYDSKKIIYCLWKILCIRSPLRVLVCYQENKQHLMKLTRAIEEAINKNRLMEEEKGSLLVLIGNEGISEDAPWGEYFSICEWDGTGLKAFIP